MRIESVLSGGGGPQGELESHEAFILPLYTTICHVETGNDKSGVRQLDFETPAFLAGVTWIFIKVVQQDYGFEEPRRVQTEAR